MGDKEGERKKNNKLQKKRQEKQMTRKNIHCPCDPTIHASWHRNDAFQQKKGKKLKIKKKMRQTKKKT